MRTTFGKPPGSVVVSRRWQLAVSFLVALAVSAALVAACGSEGDGVTADSPTVSSAPGTARATVVAFYTAHSEGSEADAYALLSKVHDPVATVAEYVEQTRWRRDLRLEKVGKALPDSAAGRPAYYQRLHDLRQVEVEFFQEHDAVARERGEAIEFVTVAREIPDGPWRIIELGTGP